MKFELVVNGQPFEVEAENEKALPEIAETISRQQRATQQPSVTGQQFQPAGQFQGEIKPPPTGAERVQSALPGIGQFAGGLLGGGAGAVVGGPTGAAAGSALMGTFGRGLGLLGEKTAERVQRDPTSTFGFQAPFGPVGETLKDLTKEEKGQMGKDVSKAAATEAFFAPIGLGIGNIFGGVGKNILGALLGDRVAERGAEVGFKNILKPEFFEGRLPKAIAKKAGGFFDKLLTVTGKGVKRAVNSSPAKDQVLSSQQIQQGLIEINKRLGSFDEFSDALVSKSQKKILRNVTKELLDLDGDVPIPEIWEARKRLDKVLFGKKFGPEAQEYLKSIRKLLNNPIKEASEEVAESFSKYSFVVDQQDDLGKHFEISEFGGETFAPKVEKFAGGLLKTSNDEQMRLLRQLDDLLGADEKVIDDLLNVAAAEAIDKPIQLLGLPSRILAGALGGRRSVAGMGRFAQSPFTRGTGKALGRGLVTGTTELLQDE